MIKFLERVGFIILFCVIGFFLGYFYGWANLNGYFIQWKSLGEPPAMSTEIARINNGIWVKTSNGEIFHYEDTVACTNECWIKENSIPPVAIDTISLQDCSSPRQKLNFVDYQGVCQAYGPGFTATYYGITSDGTIYEWGRSGGEGDALIAYFAPIIGVIVGLILSVAIVVLLYIIDSRKYWNRYFRGQ